MTKIQEPSTGLNEVPHATLKRNGHGHSNAAAARTAELNIQSADSCTNQNQALIDEALQGKIPSNLAFQEPKLSDEAMSSLAIDVRDDRERALSIGKDKFDSANGNLDAYLGELERQQGTLTEQEGNLSAQKFDALNDATPRQARTRLANQDDPTQNDLHAPNKPSTIERFSRLLLMLGVSFGIIAIMTAMGAALTESQVFPSLLDNSYSKYLFSGVSIIGILIGHVFIETRETNKARRALVNRLGIFSIIGVATWVLSMAGLTFEAYSSGDSLDTSAIGEARPLLVFILLSSQFAVEIAGSAFIWSRLVTVSRDDQDEIFVQHPEAVFESASRDEQNERWATDVKKTAAIKALRDAYIAHRSVYAEIFASEVVRHFHIRKARSELDFIN